MAGSQDFVSDPRNEHALIWLNSALVPRADAKVSIFDAGFVLGDGIWEGLRLHKGAIVFLEPHLHRLYSGAKAIALDIGLTRDEMRAALRELIAANKMETGVHIRLMVTRGLKRAVNQDPRNSLGRATVAIVAEYKEPSKEISTEGLKLFTSSIRCTGADMFDMRLNSHSRLALIRALLDVIPKGADEALMLDPHGFISSCNATNFFFVYGDEVCTSTGEFCFNGITRDNVIALCRAHGIAINIGNFTLGDAARAEEAFVTGTFGGITPVSEIDGRKLPEVLPGPMTKCLRGFYAKLKDDDAAR